MKEYIKFVNPIKLVLNEGSFLAREGRFIRPKKIILFGTLHKNYEYTWYRLILNFDYLAVEDYEDVEKEMENFISSSFHSSYKLYKMSKKMVVFFS
jgi:hypothetical protein